MTRMIHIINHTHWDREWFLSSVYTTHWIPGLIDRLEQLTAENAAFRYLLDGQTLIIEDLVAAYPAYRSRVKQLVQSGGLTIGPYYCQPDWKLTSGESLIRNLQYGQQDAAEYGATMRAGWLVDTFGHISQAPQIHRQAGIDAVYVWRGVPELAPYFWWTGASGEQLLAINLFGGYRNLYGVTHVPEVAVARLEAEVAKLAPYYPTADIPLFDGYDLEDNPEDPVSFYRQRPFPPNLTLLEATPDSFVAAVRQKLDEIPTLHGELNSGKYGATFPGVYSTRTYLKVMSRDCAHLLHQVAEPLAVLAWLKGRPYQAAQYEAWSRTLLQNSVHDCICGVSIDLVHEKMEWLYRQVFDGAQADVRQSLAVILADCAPGTYAVSTNPFACRSLVEVDGRSYEVQTAGIGVWQLPAPLAHSHSREVADSFAYENAHDAVSIAPDGAVESGGRRLGYLAVYAEHGDTYSNEGGALLGRLQPVGPLTIERGGAGCRVSYHAELAHGSVWIKAAVRIDLGVDELLRWQVELDSGGVEFRVDFVCETAVTGRVVAGMPFDTVERPFADADLLPRALDPQLATILMGQRELNEVRTFPFHEYVALTDGRRTAVLFAKGVHAYTAQADGTLAITLRRSVEWVTRANLKDRIGDAGPFFYVPDARCERVVRHELALALGDIDVDGMQLQRLNAAFQNPPLIVTKRGNGRQTAWQWLQADAPLSSLQVVDGQVAARWYNPTTQPTAAADEQIPAKTIHRQTLAATPQPAPSGADTPCEWINPAAWRVGKQHGRPNPAQMAELEQAIQTSAGEMQRAQAQLQAATGRDRHKWQHQVYVHQREWLEYRLSRRLNQLKLAAPDGGDAALLFTPDAETAEIGWQLNQLRIKRRIYDYVVASL